jgi:hypothetical protein
MPKATSEAERRRIILFALILSVLIAALWLGWFSYLYNAGKKDPSRSAGITVE